MMKKSLLCIVLTLLMVFTSLPMTVSAANPITLYQIDEFRFACDEEAIALKSNISAGEWMSNLKAKGGVKAATDTEGWVVDEALFIYDWNLQRRLQDNEYPNLSHTLYLRIRVELLNDNYIFRSSNEGSSYPVYVNGRFVSSDVLDVYNRIDLLLMDKIYLKSAAIKVSNPTIGAKPENFVPSLVDSPHLSIKDWSWDCAGYGDETSYRNSFSTFEEGYNYYLYIQIEIEDGYEFPMQGLNTATVKINGKEVDYSTFSNLVTTGDFFKPQSSTSSGYTVSGTVTSYLNNTGAVKVTMVNRSNNMIGFTKTVYGNSAAFSFTNVPAGIYLLTFSKENHVSKTVTIGISGNASGAAFQINPIGDISGDGKITTKDYAMANAHAMKKTELSGYPLACGDVLKNDGKVTTADAARINAAAMKVSPLW